MNYLEKLPKRLRKALPLLLNLSLFIALLIYVGISYQNDAANIDLSSISINWLGLVIAQLFFGATFFLFLVAWQKLLSAYGYDFQVADNIYAYSVTMYTRHLPSPVWMILGRSTVYSDIGITPILMTNITFFEILLHGIASIILFLPVAIFSSNHIGIKIMSLVLFLSIWIIILAYKKFPSLSLRLKIPSQKVTVSLVLIYLVTWLLAAPFFWFIIYSTGHHGSISINTALNLWLISGIATFISNILTLGLGGGFLRELTLFALLTNFIPLLDSAIISLLVRLMLIFGTISWGVIGVIISQLIKKYRK